MAAMGTVRVVFIDAETGQMFARSELPAEQLPDSFAIDTTMNLGGDPWQVERAEPLTAAEAAASGQLALTVRRIQFASPKDILYSLPTICESLPDLGHDPVGSDSFELREDDWRQVELISSSRSAAIRAEFDGIGQIFAEHGHRDSEGRLCGFKRIHMRSITPFAEPLPWSSLRGLLATMDNAYHGANFRGTPNLIAGSFAYGSGPVACYGILDGDQVPVLGLATAPGKGPVPIAAIEAVLGAFDLVLVDWCRGAVVGPDRLADYLGAIEAA